MAQLIRELVGHRETLMPLLEANASGRMASTLLFAGPSGIGKKKAALVLAQAMVCERAQLDACGECGSCLRIERGQSESLRVISPEGSQIKIEQARDILHFLTLQKLGRSRAVIIDQAHLLNPQAGNALLKSLEEPPPGTHFILVTHLQASLLSTIRSRAQLVRFKPLSDQDVRRILGPDADDWVVESAQGSVETARRLEESQDDYIELERLASAYLEAAMRNLPVDEISRLKDVMKDRSAQAYVASLIQGVLRDALRLQAGVRPARSKGAPDLTKSVADFDPASLRILADLSIEFEQDLGRNVDRGLVLENFAIQWRLASQVR